jgi:hypothetical protein
MPIELAPNPIKALEIVKSGIQTEAEHLSAKAEDYFQRYPDVIGAEGSEHSAGATNQRIAEVYSRTSEQIGVVLLQHKRDMVRAMNPFFSKLNDEEVDKIAKEYDLEGIFG